jgi:CDP-glycerol glycerophosphotransferase (TagB/SpsB family)
MIAKGEMHWDKLRGETHRTLFAFAKSQPQIDIVIKTHPQQLDLKEIQKEINDSGANNIIVASGPTISNQLIVNADCVIGFQTTALIEAMVTDKPIIYTFWGEAKDRWANDLIPFHQTEGVLTVTSSEQLTNALTSIVTQKNINPGQRQARDTFIAEYFTTVDGRSAQRTIEAIDRLLPAASPVNV